MVQFLKSYIVASVSFILISFILISCEKSNQNRLETIDFDLAETTLIDSVFEYVEVVPLEIIEGKYPSGISRVIVEDSLSIIKDNNDVIYIYSDNGNYISDSHKRIGNGSGEYQNIMGLTFNKYTHNIDLITPAEVICYDLNFNFVNSFNLPNHNPDNENESVLFSEIHAISPTKYLLIPTTTSQDNHQIYLYDTVKGEFEKKFSFDKGLITDVSMQLESFYDQPNDEVLFFPPGSLNSLFILDTSKFSFNKSMLVSLGENGVSENDIAHYKSDIEGLRTYMLTSDKTIPLRSFKCGDTLIFITKDGNSLKKFHTLFFNPVTRNFWSIDSFDKDKFTFPLIDCVDNGNIYAVIDSEQLNTLLSSLSEKKVITHDGEIPEERYVILKYKLR